MRQTQAVLKIIDREYRKGLRDQLRIQVLAVHGDPKEVMKMVK